MKKFIKGTIPDLPFQKAQKKPIPMQCCQINEAFEIETMEGLMRAKAGDWLVVGVKGEMWAIDDSVFRETYEILAEHQG